MEGKKISFGFMKTKKADKPLAVNNDEKREYIESIEEKSIKVVGGEEVKTNDPLVIPMKPNTLITADRLKEIAEKVESALEEPEIKQEPVDDTSEQPAVENETLEQMAVRELMQEVKKEVKVESATLAIPTPAKTIPEGEKESTLDDYEAVPIQEFGMAMLRGMGWTPGKDGSKYKQPELRPKGLGLGADKVVKQKKKEDQKDGKGEELAIVKNSFVKITNGKYNGYYGKVVSLDEDNGRVMVDIPVKKETVSLSEFMMQAVTKSEYDRESKVINAESFEEYKKKEISQKSSRQEDKSSSSQRQDEKEIDRKDRQRETDNNDRRYRDSESANGRSRNRQRRDSSSSEDRSRNRQRRDSSDSEDRSSKKKKKDRKRYSSNDSLSSLSEDERRHHKHSKHKNRRRSRSRSQTRKKSRTPEGKRDIDKKRKGKKKKRDRDRSPNYKKHRK